MRAGELFGQTLREAPAEAEIPSHKLLVRGAFLRRVTAGIYAWLPLGLRVLRKVERIVREEMNRQGASEILMPMLHPGDLWKQTGRWDAYGPVLYRLKDRSDRDFCLGPTHEEIVTFLASTELPSYRDLPSIPYQIQWKFRDEPRARGGLLRGREFLMKDAYSFDSDEAGLKASYDKMVEAYGRVFDRCRITAVMIEAQAGVIGGSVNHEFVQPAENGEDTFVKCASCGYAANTEAAESRVPEPYDFGSSDRPQKVHTPGLVTVEEVASFLGVEGRQLAKAMMYRAGEGLVCALVPGDRELNEYKLGRALGGVDVEMMTDADFQRAGVVKGFAGPIGLSGIKLLADRSLQSARNLVTGANEAGHHLTGVEPGRDFAPDEWADLVVANDGDACDRCGGSLAVARGVEVAHVFQLGPRYSEALDARYTDESGRRRPFVMGCYGFGVSRAVAAAVEEHHDERGIIWPRTLAPYEVVVLALGADRSIREAAAVLHDDLEDAGAEVLLDDRDVSPGVKFADADLIGYPLQVVVGKTFATSGRVEAKVRATGERSEVAPGASSVVAVLASCP